MGRPFWSGSISFGLVQIPVGVQSAEEHGETIDFTMIDEKDGSPIGYRYVNKATGEEVPKERRVKGYAVAKDDYVIMKDADFKRANVKKTETIDIQAFVDAGEIPMTRFEKPYWLSPSKKGLKPYALLRAALEKTGKVALATVVLRQRQSLCLIAPVGGALLLEMLRYDDELRAPTEAGIDQEGLAAVKVTKPELEMAERLVEGMATSFDTHELRDTYHDDLMALIEERRANPEHAPAALPKQTERKGEVVDIMALLKRSVEARGGGPDGKAPSEHRAQAPRRRATPRRESRA